MAESRSDQDESSQGDLSELERVCANVEEACVIVAGKPGSGKSTALNNIFDLDLPTAASPRAVTKAIEIRYTTKKGVTLTAIDTPGLGDLNIDKKTATNRLADTIRKLDYTFLYCLSVAPSSRLTETDRAIIKNLHSILGKEVWDKCVICLTFSDTLRYEKFRSEGEKEDYKAKLQEFSQEFHLELKKCGADVPELMTIFDYGSNKEREEMTPRNIVAVPVGINIGDRDILPDVMKTCQNWTDVAFLEILKKTNSERRDAFLKFKYAAVILSITGGAAVAGAGIGAGIGGIAGVIGGPLGAGAGAGVGAAVGGAVGTVVGLPISTIAALIKWRKEHSYKKDKTI